MYAVEIEHLTKRYDDGTPAVNGITLKVPQGQFFGLAGPNGAGKTSTIHCMTGIARITEGAIRVMDHDVIADYRAARRCIGLSPQEFNVDLFATVRQILDWMGGFYGLRRHYRQQRTQQLLDRFGLVPHAGKAFRALSGGLKRRVLLARALLHDPPVVILDEPTAGVDVELRRQLWRFLREINEEGKTIVLTTHYIEEIELLCQRAAVMRYGEVVADGSIEELRGTAVSLEERYLELTHAAL